MPGYDKSRFIGVSEHDLEEFTCGICIEIFCNPVVTTCCRTTYCSECIKEWLTGHNTCPNDRKVLGANNLTPAPRVLLNLLNNMKIRCDFHADGCQKVIHLSSLSAHTANCEFGPKKKCKFCKLGNQAEPRHNCVQNLIVLNDSLNYRVEKLVEENAKLKKDLENLSKRRAKSGDNSDDMNSVIESARKHINNPEIEISTVSSLLRLGAVEKAKEAITKNDSYPAISRFLSESYNRGGNTKRWHAIAYARKCGESSLWSDDYICISFGQLRVEVFSVGFRDN